MGGLTEEGIALFVSTESLPLVVDFNHETAQKIFSGEVKSHFLLFSSAKADDYEAKVAILKDQAMKNKGKMCLSLSTLTKKTTRGSWSSSELLTVSCPPTEPSDWARRWPSSSQRTTASTTPSSSCLTSWRAS